MVASSIDSVGDGEDPRQRGRSAYTASSNECDDKRRMLIAALLSPSNNQAVPVRKYVSNVGLIDVERSKGAVGFL